MPFVHVEDLGRRYDGGVIALEGVSFDLERGEWLAVMGPSGSGKSTLLNILGGLDAADSGQVVVDGVDLTRASRQELIRHRREKIGLVFQQFHLIPYLTAVENVMLAQYLHSMADEKEAIEALRSVGLGERLRHLPAALSGGEKQRVCIARALINRPALLLADEPTGNLDEENQRIVLDLFQGLKDAGQTIVLVSHDLAVGRRADRQIQLEHGRLAGYHLTPFQADEDIDEVLEYLWLVREGHPIPPEVCARGGMLAGTALIEQMRRKNLVRKDPAGETFTDEGERRAERLIRRHRLAEMLFAETFQMEAHQVEEEACYFEHILSPTMTDSICAFLGHPHACPHGHAIPEGVCCGPARGKATAGERSGS